MATATARQVAGALRQADVLLYTSRDLIQGRSRQRSLAISRTVSAALARITGLALAARPAWIIAKGGITSHDVAVQGLGMRRAEVAGQLFDGLISVFRPADADPDAIGMPYVVFPGNVGDDEMLSRPSRSCAAAEPRVRSIRQPANLAVGRTGQPVTDRDDALDMPYRVENGLALMIAANLARSPSRCRP